MRIENLKTGALIPYANNPRKNDRAVEYVANSIRQFGFKNPIIIDKNNVIVAGHTRLLAAKSLGLATVPCIRADDLTDEQIKAFRLADNKVAEMSTWDIDKLNVELENLDIDMGDFGFNLDIPIDTGDDDGWYGDERERTGKAYNLDLLDWGNVTNDFWQMPKIDNCGVIPTTLTGFNYAKTCQDKRTGIHFYIDDYQFERVWNYPEKYLAVLSEYECVLTPDFSLYMDMPMPLKIWNVYRSRQIGAYYQSKGLNVIPTVSWAEPETYAFCFQGLAKGGVVSISTVGVKRDAESLAVWKDGTAEMIRRLEPETILVYGGKLDFDYGGIDVRYYENKVTENWKNSS